MGDVVNREDSSVVRRVAVVSSKIHQNRDVVVNDVRDVVVAQIPTLDDDELVQILLEATPPAAT
ncbi:MAG: hypothetical protein M3Y91_12810 [Actinomycetota bacterium]|nr:hypothetical protein [Actinomycetota bacterium]